MFCNNYTKQVSRTPDNQAKKVVEVMSASGRPIKVNVCDKTQKQFEGNLVS